MPSASLKKPRCPRGPGRTDFVHAHLLPTPLSGGSVAGSTAGGKKGRCLVWRTEYRLAAKITLGSNPGPPGSAGVTLVSLSLGFHP